MPLLTQGIFPVRSDPLLGLNTLFSANSGNGTVQLTDKSFSFLTLPEFAPQSLAKSGTNSVSNATPVLTLTADAGFNYLVQASTNLIDWTLFAVLVNTNGAVQFSDPAFTNLSCRFYRAVSP